MSSDRAVATGGPGAQADEAAEAEAEAEAAARLASGRAWADFCDVLRQAGELVDDMPGGVDELDRTEWYRCVTRLVRVACERYVENREPARPRLRITPWRTSVNVQSPDQDHLLCELPEGAGAGGAEGADGSAADPGYVITGERGTVPYFIVAVMASPRPRHPGAIDWAPRGREGLAELDPSRTRPLATIASDEVEVGADGRFRIQVSRRRPPSGDWLALPEGATGIIVRTVHRDRSSEVPTRFQIHRLEPPVPVPRTAAQAADDLALAAQMVLGFAERIRSWDEDLAARPNELEYSRERHLGHGGVADRHFAFAVWRKPAGRALVLELVPPPCEQWNFQLCNRWQENLDVYEDGGGYVTGATAHVEPDGTVRIVVADVDPGLGGNWVDSSGHVSGLMGLRFVRAEVPPPVLVREVELAAIGSPGWSGLATVPARVTGTVVP